MKKYIKINLTKSSAYSWMQLCGDVAKRTSNKRNVVQ